MGQVQLKHMQNACGACVPFRPLRAQLHLSSICEHRGVRKRLHTQKMPSSAVLRGAIRMRNHDHPPAEKLTHPHTRRIPHHREVEHRSAKRSSAGAPPLPVAGSDATGTDLSAALGALQRSVISSNTIAAAKSDTRGLPSVKLQSEPQAGPRSEK